MTKTVVALYDDITTVHTVVNELVEHGYRRKLASSPRMRTASSSNTLPLRQRR